ncbi:MAG: oligoendopeptidase F [Vicinamibacteria bacterium]|nr:oligoendopeptidase F [Vicinamibacteria bacterium]
MPERYTWKLEDIFSSWAEFTTARKRVDRSIPAAARFQGRLAESAAVLYEALSTVMGIDQELARLRGYASQRYDENTRRSRPLERLQAVEQLAVRFGAVTAFVRPEILALGQDQVERFITEEPRLSEYRHLLRDILRWQPHTLSPEEEKIVAQAGQLTDAGDAIYSIFTNAELPYPVVTLSTGETVRLDQAAYTHHRASLRRQDRIQVFEAFWGEHRRFRRTLGGLLYVQVRSNVFHKEVHRFPSCLSAALFAMNVPEAVYRRLIEDVHASLSTLHRYLRIRRRFLGLDDLRYEDLYAPIAPPTALHFTPEQAMQRTLEALAPLGGDYVNVLRRGYEERWVDWYPSRGKRSGAYSTSVYGVHPYQLLNFDGRYEDLVTLAHESGHSMHAYLADALQPYATHECSVFVGEVASTLGEILLLQRMLDLHRDLDTRLFLLDQHLDNLRQTLFRQTLFAEFEVEIHEMAERGETLTGDNLSQVYLELLRKYYGHDAGVCRIEDLYGVEWADVPHFYYNFYVFQYATSLVASISLAEAIREEALRDPRRTPRRDAYLGMLAAGSSKYPIDLLRDAGVDMTTSAPFEAAMEEMNRTMDEIESLLHERDQLPAVS